MQPCATLSYSLSHLADHTLLRELATLVSQDRATTAALLAHLAEVDERRLYLPAAYPSMYAYCLGELRMSEDAAFRRIRLACIARQFPAILPALADGRLNLTAVLLLAPHLSAGRADELLAAAAHKTKPEIERLLAERFRQPDVPTLVQAIGAAGAGADLAAGPAGTPSLQLAARAVAPSDDVSLPVLMGLVAPEPPVPLSASNSLNRLEPLPSHAGSRAKLSALSPGRFALQVTLDQATHDQLRYAQSLLDHTLPSGDVAAVLQRALDLLVRELEQRKFARSARTRPAPRRRSANDRYVPADVRRAVGQRDGGRCTFVGESGKRCEARSRLEYDHVAAIARGGETTAHGLRLLCRAHNQHAAECTFSAGFMRGKREDARRRAAEAKAQERARAREQAKAQAEAKAQARAQAKARAQA